MSGQTISSAVERRQTGATTILGQYGKKFVTMLPTHINGDAWMRNVEATISRSKELMQACREDPGSMVQALATSALWGLLPGTDEFYLTPRPVYVKELKRKIMTTLGITGYQGYIELMFRAGAIDAVKADTVIDGEKFSYKRSDEIPDHQPDWLADRRHGELKLTYAYAAMKGGGHSQVIILNRFDIEEIKKKSPSAGSEYSPWNTNEPSMWLKSGVRQLRKWVPTSAEYINTQARAAREEAGTLYVPSEIMTLPQSDVVDVAHEDAILDAAEQEQQPQERERIEIQPAPTAAPSPDTAPMPETGAATDEPVTLKQKLTQIDNMFTSVGWTITADQIRAASIIGGRDVTALSNLTNREADALLNALNDCAHDKDPQGRLADLLGEIREGAGG